MTDTQPVTSVFWTSLGWLPSARCVLSKLPRRIDIKSRPHSAPAHVASLRPKATRSPERAQARPRPRCAPRPRLCSRHRKSETGGDAAEKSRGSGLPSGGRGGGETGRVQPRRRLKSAETQMSPRPRWVEGGGGFQGDEKTLARRPGQAVLPKGAGNPGGGLAIGSSRSLRSSLAGAARGFGHGGPSSPGGETTAPFSASPA